MVDLSVMGVSHFSDFYPNVKYKAALLANMPDIKTRQLLYDLGAGAFYSEKSPGAKVFSTAHFILGHLSVFTRYLIHRTPAVYVTYPGLFLLLLFALLPRRLRPVIYLDAFISVYDAVVHDRSILKLDDFRARLLYRLERRAFLTSDQVIVDTKENASYYCELFSLPPDKFVVMPLAIPDLEQYKIQSQRSGVFECLFVGSLVPLHGIGTILDAADRLVHIPGIRFHIIGDGQESWRISQYLESSRAANLIWERGMFSTEHIVHAIAKADLCLGIFAESPKAQRVLPYKIYYYAALGKPFVTRSTVCLRRYFPQTDNVLLCKMEDDSGASLAGMIDHYYHNPEELNKAARESAELYQQYLSPQQLQVQLTGLFSRQQVKSV